MKNFRRMLTDSRTAITAGITNPNLRRTLIERRVAVLGVAGFAAVAGITGSVVAADPAEQATAPAPVTIAAAPAAPEKALDHDFQLQENGYYCAPAATRVALTAQDMSIDQDTVAGKLGTTSRGTDSITQVTDVLNTELGKGRYRSVEIPGTNADKAQTDRFKADVIAAINADKVVVANIAGSAADTAGETHTYKGGHYIPIVGYADHGETVLVADSSGKGSATYEMSIDDMADWIASRGYSA